MKLEYLREAREAAGAVNRTMYEMEPGVIEWMADDDPKLPEWIANLLFKQAWHKSKLDWIKRYEAGARDSRERAVDIAIAALMVELGEWSREKMIEVLAEEEER